MVIKSHTTTLVARTLSVRVVGDDTGEVLAEVKYVDYLDDTLMNHWQLIKGNQTNVILDSEDQFTDILPDKVREQWGEYFNILNVLTFV